MRLLICFAATTLLACASHWLIPESSPLGPALDGIVLLSAMIATIRSLKLRLPAQNILAASILVVAIAGVAGLVSSRSGVPFGKIEYTASFKLFGMFPWPIPLIWMVVILNAREVARLCLRPWRVSRSYGIWLASLAAGLAVVFDVGLEPFALGVRSYWTWPKIISPLSTAPWINFLGWFVLAFAILLCVAPWLIRKRPAPEPKNFLPLWTWLSVNLYLAVGNAKLQFWVAAVVTLLINGVITKLAAREPRPRPDTVNESVG